MNTFQIQLAGKIIELSAQYPYLLTYCSEYLVTGTPDLSIAVQPADIAFEREKIQTGGFAGGNSGAGVLR